MSSPLACAGGLLGGAPREGDSSPRGASGVLSINTVSNPAGRAEKVMDRQQTPLPEMDCEREGSGRASGSRPEPLERAGGESVQAWLGSGVRVPIARVQMARGR